MTDFYLFLSAPLRSTLDWFCKVCTSLASSGPTGADLPVADLDPGSFAPVL
jgi:hypothetical protein